MVLKVTDVRKEMQKDVIPHFDMRHRLALALEYSSVSISEMAAELGASRTTISNYLHGRTKPKRPDLIVWALKCGVPFEWLVTGEGAGSTPTEEVESQPTAAKPRRSRVRNA